MYKNRNMKKTKNQLTFWLKLSSLSFSIALTTIVYTQSIFILKNLFYISNYNKIIKRENYKLIELAAKLQELILNHKDGKNNNLNWKHSELTN